MLPVIGVVGVLLTAEDRAFSQYLHGDWNHRKDYDCNQNHRKVLADVGDVSEKVAAEDKKADPNKAPDEIIGKEFLVRHQRHPGYKRRERAHPGNKPSQDNGCPTSIGEEMLRLFDMLRLSEWQFTNQQAPSGAVSD